MKIRVLIAFIFLIGTASADQAVRQPNAQQKCNEDVLATGFKGIPKDASSVADRLASCSHFSGEYGDDSDRNAEINRTLKELKCDTVERDVAAIKLKYSKNPSVLNALSCAAEL